MSKVLIPTELVAPYIERFVRQSFLASGEMDGFQAPVDAYAILGLRSGVDKEGSKIRRIAACGQPNVEFDTADKIFCALGLVPMVWYQDERLRDYYDRLLPRCANPDCGKEIAFRTHHTMIPDGGSGLGPRVVSVTMPRKYCSDECRGLHYNRTHTKSRARAVRRHRNKNREAYNAYMREYRARRTAEGRPCR